MNTFNMTINKKELKYITYSVIFLLTWFILILPVLIEKFNGNSPFLQFIFFNVGLVIFFQIFLKSKAVSSTMSLMGAIGIICLILAIDTAIPEYHCSTLGEPIVGGILGASTTDYNWCMIANNFGLNKTVIHIPDFIINILNWVLSLFTTITIPIPLLISLAYLFSYFIMPIILLIISAQLIPNFTKHV